MLRRADLARWRMVLGDGGSGPVQRSGKALRVFDQFRAGKRDKSGPTEDMPLSSAASATFPGGYDPVAAACTVIIEAAGTTSWPLGKDDQRRVLRKARGNTHPDLNDGARTEWDKVEDAARTLRMG